MKKNDGRKTKTLHEKCGKEFSPAGYATHVKHCTGPDYNPQHTHSVPGRHDAKAKRPKPGAPDGRKVLQPCEKGCGRELYAAGRAAHERYCEGPGYTPGYSAKRRVERRIGPSNLQVKTKGGTYNVTYARVPKTDMKTIYDQFQDDSEMFSIFVHLMSAANGYDVMTNLEAAKRMIDRKMELLEKP